MMDFVANTIVGGTLFLAFLGQSDESILQQFFSRLELEKAVLVVRTTDTISGKAVKTVERFRIQGKFGLEVKLKGESLERRWIWNPNYKALVMQDEHDRWAVEKMILAEDRQPDGTLGVDFGELFLGSPVWERIVSLEQGNYLYDSNIKLNFSPESNYYSKDKQLNSVTLRFDENLDLPRLLEVGYFERFGQSNEKLEFVIQYEYPAGEFVPLKRTVTATHRGGASDGRTLAEKVTMITGDPEHDFDRDECYLAYYGLPEPKVGSAKLVVGLWVYVVTVVAGIIAVWLWLARKTS